MKRYGLIGKTLRHSFSRQFFTDKFQKEGRTDCRYDLFELPSVSFLPGLIRETAGLEGLNVTIPYKEAVLPYLHSQDEVVQGTGACNCIRLRNGRLEGFNTDVFGFLASLQPLLRPFHRKALVLGTGGAAKAVNFALRSLHIDVQAVSRTPSPGMLTYADLDDAALRTHLLIVNTTPLGTFPDIDEKPPIPYGFLSPQHLLYDLVYNPALTAFLKEGQQKGASVKNGHEMLALQAEESWRIWNR